MDLLAIWLGKLTLLALRATGRRGTALPGLVVEKAFPGFLTRRLARLPHGVVVVWHCCPPPARARALTD